MKSALIAMLALMVLNSCSWYRNMERSLVDDDQKQSKRSKTVSREQYDQLLIKYEELSKKYQSLKQDPNSEQYSLVDELQKSSSKDSSLDTETVDVFPTNGLPLNNQQVVVAVTQDVPSNLESQLELFKNAMAIRNTNPGEATKIFQQLEAQGNPAISVRAKLQIGELLLGKSQFDLALQVFEDVINKNAHSGVVLDALKYAVVCSEKLGLKNKKDQYASMLNDVFEYK